MAEAALRFRKEKDLLGRPEPAAVARALTILGFGETTDFADTTIASYEQTEGFLGDAAKAARYAYERNVWSQHWYGQMKAANSAEAFWSSSVLLRKIVDGRFDVWSHADPDNETTSSFTPSLDPEIKKRIGRWKSAREKTFLGGKPPTRIFLQA